MKTKEFMERIEKIGNTERFNLEDLRQQVGYSGSIECFRVLCWRNKIPFAKGHRGRYQAFQALGKLKADGYDFEHSTLAEIKTAMDYEGGLDGLAGLLKRHNIEWKKCSNNYPTDHQAIVSRIQAIGNTSKMTPKEILANIGLEIQNPAQYLLRLNVPYRKKGKKSA